MIVKELISKLNNVDPEMDIYCTSATGEYEFGLVHNARVKTLNFPDESDEDNEVTRECFVIEEQ